MKRVELINCELGTHIWVTEDRVDEYLKAGHKPAETPVQAAAPQKPAKPARKTAKK